VRQRPERAQGRGDGLRGNSGGQGRAEERRGVGPEHLVVEIGAGHVDAGRTSGREAVRRKAEIAGGLRPERPPLPLSARPFAEAHAPFRRRQGEIARALAREQPRLEARIGFQRAVPVQVVRQHVHQHGDVRAEFRAGFELEGAGFDHQPGGIRRIENGLADGQPVVAARHGALAGRLQAFGQRLDDAALAVAARHRDRPAAEPAPAQFHFRKQRDPAAADFA